MPMYFYVLHSGASSFILHLFWRHLLALNFNTGFPWTILTDESSTVFRLCKKQMTAAGTKHCCWKELIHLLFICLLKQDFSSRESPFWMWSHSCFLFRGIIMSHLIAGILTKLCQMSIYHHHAFPYVKCWAYWPPFPSASRFPAVCAPWGQSVCSCPHRRELCNSVSIEMVERSLSHPGSRDKINVAMHSRRTCKLDEKTWNKMKKLSI